VQERLLGPEHPSTLNTANNLAQSLATQGKYADAERIKSEVYGVCKRVLGLEHPDTLSAAGNLNCGHYARDRAKPPALLADTPIFLASVWPEASGPGAGPPSWACVNRPSASCLKPGGLPTRCGPPSRRRRCVWRCVYVASAYMNELVAAYCRVVLRLLACRPRCSSVCASVNTSS
jgi:hypothetical protein